VSGRHQEAIRGRDCRDAFLGLNKTCAKARYRILGLSRLATCSAKTSLRFPYLPAIVQASLRHRLTATTFAPLTQMSGVDLKLDRALFGVFSEESLVNIRQDAVRPTHGFSAMEHISRGLFARYGGDAGVERCGCAEQYRAMAFAQLTYRESLRDIEVCLSAASLEVYHMAFASRFRRSTLADANETRDWRIYAEFAHRLIAQAPQLYADESFGLELTNTVLLWTRPPSIFACRCFHGRTFAPPRRR